MTKQARYEHLSERSASVLLVGALSPSVSRKLQRLHDAGFQVTHAESICHAELFSEAQYFDAAVYDELLSAVEQVSLARIMRLRWPWMRLIRCDHAAVPEQGLFDATTASEASLLQTILDHL